MVTTVIRAVTPELVANAAAIHTSPVAFLTNSIGTVGLLLIRLVLAVRHPVTRQAVVDAVAVSTLKVIDTSA